MIYRSLALLLATVATVAAASQPTLSGSAGASGAPLDRNPIVAYPPGLPGPPQTIAGQCFVVTDGGQRIKLAQVVVEIYPRREFDWYAQEVSARCKARFEEVKAVACPKNFAALSLLEMDRSIAAAEVLRRELHLVWQVLPTPEASTRTDADGRFSVAHHVAPPYVVFAVGSRTFGGETEYYRWQVSSNVITDPLQVELSNDNLR